MAELDPSTRDELESFVTEWLSDHRIPGAAVSVVDPDGTIYAEGFGARNLEQNAEATENTLFGIGSSTKSFTAVAIMQLVDAGEISVDDPVSDYLPHLDDVEGEPITIHELLTHTSGMPSDGMAGPLITRPLGVGHVEVPLSSDDDFRRHVKGSADRRVTDRDTFFYYNSGFTMLGQIVEEVTGRTYADYVEDEILGPVGMARSTFDREAFEEDDDHMTPYIKGEEGSQQSDFPFDPLIQAPGGMVSSALEMGEYIRLYMNDGEVDGERVLSAESLDQMTTADGTFGEYIDGTEVGYGYGLMVEDLLGDTMVGHGGSIAVSTSWFGYLEDAELGVAISCTTSPEAHPMIVGAALLAILQGEDPVDTIPHYQLLDALESVTGEYGSYRDIASATVERDGGTLKFTQQAGTDGQELHLVPETLEDDLLVCSAYLSMGMRHPVRFELDGDDVTCFFERSRFVKE